MTRGWCTARDEVLDPSTRPGPSYGGDIICLIVYHRRHPTPEKWEPRGSPRNELSRGNRVPYQVPRIGPIVAGCVGCRATVQHEDRGDR